MTQRTLNKTQFISYLDCPLHMWALTHDVEPKPPSAMDLFRRQQGQDVEKLAYTFLEEYILPGYEQGTLLRQRTYQRDVFLARTDALIDHPQADCFDLYEIKSSSRADKRDLYDLAFQVYVCQELPIGRAFLVHLNPEYQRRGKMDLGELFLCEDLSEAVRELQGELESSLLAARVVLQQHEPKAIESCRKPRTCPFPGLCHPNLLEHPIYEISRLHKNKARLLEERGIARVEDIPADFTLSERQRAFVDTVLAGEPSIDRDAIRRSLEELVYPLYFLDYETCNPALPAFDGYHPNQHITFQYSLHVVEEPGGEAEHHAFLHTTFCDPAPALLEQLSREIGAQGSVVVWNKAFEVSRNCDMAALCPQYAPFLENVNQRVFDLMDIFSKGYYIHPAFHGSASIKYVLPVLVSELSYEGMPIAKGDQASIAWWQMVNGESDEEENARLQNDLLNYCQLDTRAMLEIYQQILRLF